MEYALRLLVNARRIELSIQKEYEGFLDPEEEGHIKFRKRVARSKAHVKSLDRVIKKLNSKP